VPAVKHGTHTSFGPIKQMDAGVLNIGYAEAGPAEGPAVILLHGWPCDIYSFVDAARLLTSAGYHVIVPYLLGYGTTSFLSSATMRNRQQSAGALDIIALMDALKIQQAIVAGFDWGARTADVMAALWPERCKGIVSVSGYLIGNPAAAKQTPFPPRAAFAFWYQYYCHRYRTARLPEVPARFREAHLADRFTQVELRRRHVQRLCGLTQQPGPCRHHDPQVPLAPRPGRRRAKNDDLEKRLAAVPIIAVPAITMEGESNGAIHADSAAYRNKFSAQNL
jgi:pimeloyl-ACP methyl ester carboxylesterase